MRGMLVLEDNSRYYGYVENAIQAVGEVVFNTGMTGYQEVLTDPSYCGQIVTMTYPLIGNYGTADIFNQSAKSFVKGFVISELALEHSNWQAEKGLRRYLLEHEIPFIYGVDTRAVTRSIRSKGAMKGIIVPVDTPEDKIKKLLSQSLPQDVVNEVTTKEHYTMGSNGKHIVVMDFGIKRNILNSLVKQNFRLTVVGASTTAEEVLAYKPDGIFLSNGPGDPKVLTSVINTVKKLISSKKPIFGICLGHQLLALALGAETYKLKFGHRGSNQPVKDIAKNKIYITSQNHGYAVEEKSLNGLDIMVTHKSVNDNTIEGIRHKTLPIFSVQYHPEAAPGPDDNTYLFKEFAQMLEGVE